MSDHQFYYTDLMYNRPNWRDTNKDKNVSRNEAIEDHFTLQKQKNLIFLSTLVTSRKLH